MTVVVLKNYAISVTVCPALSKQHSNQCGPSNLVPKMQWVCSQGLGQFVKPLACGVVSVVA